MLIELNNIFNTDGAALQLDYTMTLSAYELNGTCPFQTPVSIVGQIRNNVGIVSLAAKASFTYSGCCDRCAEAVARDFTVHMDHLLVTHLNNEENDDYLVVDNGILDLDELALADILLALPSKILCQDDCQGLCPICGQNLNQSHCNCKKPVDPRLAALMQLLEE